jgi:hypothetical protein
MFFVPLSCAQTRDRRLDRIKNHSLRANASMPRVESAIVHAGIERRSRARSARDLVKHEVRGRRRFRAAYLVIENV